MSDEIVTPQTISGEFLHDLLDSAYIENRLDEDGEVQVLEGYRFWLRVMPQGKRIKMVAVFGFKSDATLDERLAYVNLVNDDLIAIRASVPLKDPDMLMFDYFFPVEGGVTKRAIVYSVKMFGELVSAALKNDADNIIE